MAQEYANLVQAVAAVAPSASGAGVDPTYTWSAGINVASADNAHTAAGVYAIVLDRPAAAADCAIFVTQRGASDATFEVVHTSDTIKTVTVLVAGVASDVPGFDMMVVGRPNT